MKEFQEKGNKTSTGVAYYASKTLAERGDYLVFFFGSPSEVKVPPRFLQWSAAWDFYEQHKSEIKWDLVVINPPFVSFFIYLQQ